MIAARGKKLQVFDFGRDGALPEGLADAVIGPSGKLRAPVLRAGTTWLVGFSAEAYAERLS